MNSCDAGIISIRCLIVDDNRAFLEVARMLLERQGLHVVGVASTSDAAMSEAAALQPDVILVDIALGDESGLDLARRLDAVPETRDAAVVLISTHAEADFGDLIVVSPAVGFLPKAELSATSISRLVDGRPR